MASSGKGNLLEENDTHAISVVNQKGERPDLYRIVNKEEGDYTEGTGLEIQAAMRDVSETLAVDGELPEDDLNKGHRWSDSGFASNIELNIINGGEEVSFYEEEDIFDLLELFQGLPDFTPEDTLSYVPMDDAEE